MLGAQASRKTPVEVLEALAREAAEDIAEEVQPAASQLASQQAEQLAPTTRRAAPLQQ